MLARVRLALLLISCVGSVVLASTALAGVILQPAFLATDMGSNFATSEGNTRDQSGLSLGYTSLATDFDAYIASDPTHAFLSSNIWVSDGLISTGNFDFDLGGTFNIQSMALWNLGADDGRNLREFELSADDNAAFSSPVSLGGFDANPNTGPFAAVLPEVFTFAPTSAAFVRMVITSNNGAGTTGFGEAAFEVQPSVVPEPSALVLALLGLLWPILQPGLLRNLR